MADMEPIYQANNEQQGYERLLEFEEKWGKNIR
jgi:transposase-like protein